MTKLDKMIHFDSQSWESIRDTIDKINEIGCMQLGETEEGETITFDVCKSDGGYDILKTEVLQKNWWTRINYYDPQELTVEESYRKEH